MNSKQLQQLLIIASIIIAFLVFRDQKRKTEIKTLKSQLDDLKEINFQVRQRLKVLMDSETDVDPAVAKELQSIHALLEIKEPTKAALALAKIIETLLKQLYSSDEAFQKSKSRLTFADYLKHALDQRIISEEDYHLVSVLRVIRNQEAHELDLKKEPSRIVAAFVAGFAFAFALMKLVRKSVRAADA